ncbi:MAG: type II CAAX endopeptidase family protein [Oscillospiraceae bacterium]
MKKREAPVFVDTLTKPRRIAGYVYLPFHIFVFPLFIGMLAQFLPSGLDNVAANIIYYGLGLAFCFICMWQFLRDAFDTLLDNILKVIFAILFAYIINMLLSYAVAAGLLLFLQDIPLNPNNNAVVTMADKSYNAVMGLAVFLAPIVEEILFRGVLFGGMRKHSRVLAYIITITLFAFYHIWQYALVSMDWRTLIYMVQYIPAGFALSWLYERTNCIWAPIFLHTAMNLISMLVLS